MSIKSSAFGGVRLSGKDATKFVRQVGKAKPNEAATTSVKRGMAMVKAYTSTGTVKIKFKDGKFIYAE
jgi:hypothetical protein